MDASFWDGKRAPGIVDTINVNEYDSVVECIDSAFKRYADRKAFTSVGYTLTYREIDEYSAAFASYLQNHTTLQPGDRVAVQMPNIMQCPIAVYGVLRAGMILVNTNPLYTEREMLHQFNDSGAKALVCMDMFAKSVQSILPETGLKHVIVTSLADMLPFPKRQLINAAAKYIKKMIPDYSLPTAVRFRKALSLGKSAGAHKKNHITGHDSTIVLQYTGGTTGVAKGAELTNLNLIANMLQARANMAQVDDNGKPLKPAEGATVVAPLPLYHIYSFTVHLMAMLDSGDHSILIANPRDSGMFIKMIKPHRLDGFVGLNTLFVGLLNHPEFKECNFEHLNLTLSGGTALMDDTAKRWKETTGCGISEGYGLTECSPIVAVNPAAGLERLGTVGQAVPGTSLKCIDDQGNEVAQGERGELCVKGPQVMKGYWNRPEATADSFTEDGEWLKTGDVAVIDDDGFVKIVDRIKDMILVSGFNVYPNEIEEVVAAHPAVENCAAIGIPDEKSGEAVKLFVISTDKNLTADDIKAHCRESLTGYKQPKYIEFRDELPMTPVGKILRRELKDEEASKNKEAEPA